ncbi:hypothetical protein [uncultured Rhodoblastus sp.]|uniref:hypothetical protein n=1 Tax=uncultured Rhodoblastus sp. TaxID=543037 RepID=UPI0026015643|nr:hypothetical protein [uncultured Rhodoblastus sp.]
MTQAVELQKPVVVPKVDTAKPAQTMPMAGPHARPELTNYDACPGSGVLPSEPSGRESDPGAG